MVYEYREGANQVKSLSERVKEMQDRQNGFHKDCCGQCDDNFKNILSDAKLIADQQKRIDELEERCSKMKSIITRTGKYYEELKVEYPCDFEQALTHSKEDKGE